MRSRVVAAVCMPDRGHFQRIRAVVAGLVADGARVVVHTGAGLRAEVEAAGAEFQDLFATCTVEQADDASWPPVCRYVSFAGRFAETLRADIGRSKPDVLVHDTFAVAGSVVARLLDLPYVNVCAGHAVVPERFLEILRCHPRVSISPACRESVERLHQEYGFTDISPFSYVTGLSPHLNLYCEPPAFLPEEDRPVFEPIAYVGSLAADAPPRGAARRGGRQWFADAARLKVFVSFGTAIWMSRTPEALAAIDAVAAWASAAGDVDVLVSLGGASVPFEARERVARQRVRVADYVDQWMVLGTADVFVTHHGLNSTHEAIAHEVPMVSYPFVWDQPGLAAVCQRLGVAVPLAEEPMTPITARDVEAAIGSIRAGRDRMDAALATAHAWERETIVSRPAVVERVLALCG